ncbi:MAG: type II secretion system protein [Phycisphaerales bacterium]
METPPASRPALAFTLIELLVVIAIIAVLIGILLPSLGQARRTARATVCLARLQQIGIGTQSYLTDFRDCLPQALGPLPGGGDAVIGALFAGKKGLLPFYGIDEIGAERRPLNKYVIDFPVPADADGGNTDLPPFKSPVDRGARSTGVPIPGLDSTESMYDLIGCSYTLNDHTLSGEQFSTLVPAGGGRLPTVVNTSKTWLIGTHTIYNFQENNNRGMEWFEPGKVEANLLFVDLHARMRIRVPEGTADKTDDYWFTPQ